MIIEGNENMVHKKEEKNSALNSERNEQATFPEHGLVFCQVCL